MTAPQRLRHDDVQLKENDTDRADGDANQDEHVPSNYDKMNNNIDVNNLQHILSSNLVGTNIDVYIKTRQVSARDVTADRKRYQKHENLTKNDTKYFQKNIQ